MEIYEIVLSAFITIFSVGLLFVSLASYKKYKNTKLLFISAVFVLFFIKAIIISYGLFDEEIYSLLSNSYFRLFDLAILMTLFMASLKR